MKKKLFIAVFILILAIPAVVRGEIIDRIVAIVNDEIITLKDVERYVRVEKEGRYVSINEYFRNIQIKDRIGVLIDDVLIRQQAKRMKISVSDKEVDQVIDNIKKQNLITDHDLQEQMKKDGMSYKDFYEGLRTNLLRTRVITRSIASEVMVTDAMINDFYDANKEQIRGEDFRVQHIFVTAQRADGQKRSLIAYERLKAGKSFEEVAREYSDEQSSAQGGDIGYVKSTELIPMLREALIQLKPGEFTPIVQTPYGYHIMKLIDKRQGEQIPLEAIREKLKEAVVQQESQKRYKDFIEKLRRASIIEIKI